MKKLALALMCLVSVAFFASCDPQIENPEPTIGFFVGEGYISNDAQIGTNEEFLIGVEAKSNIETNKLLKDFYFQVYTDDTRLWDTLAQDIDQGTYSFFAGFSFQNPGIYTITASIKDADGYTAECTMKLEVNATLEQTPINWVRKGANLVGETEAEMHNVGLEWSGSYKEIFATIKPMEGTELYVCDGNDFANLLSEQDMANYYNNLAENGLAVDRYRNITTAHSDNYNDMLFTKDANGDYHAVLISRAEIETGNYGTQITIIGAVK